MEILLFAALLIGFIIGFYTGYKAASEMEKSNYTFTDEIKKDITTILEKDGKFDIHFMSKKDGYERFKSCRN